jgi:CDP-glycerol glycerophosphotransferase
VWFVDGDDWLPPGCLTAVLDRADRLRPDLLVVDYVRSYPDGRTERFSAADTYSDALPDTFTLADRPALLRSLHIACNKVVRREFLLGTGIRFLDGWYEDVSFSLPLLLSAGRLAVLVELSYCYRQRPEGSITSTVDERHFDVFDQWHRVFGHLDTHPELAPLRPAVFARMLWHLVAVLNQPERVPPDRRRAFFAELSRMYRNYRPAEGYPVPAGTEGVSHRFVAWGAYRLYQSARTAELARRRLVAVRGRIRSATGPAVH